MPPSDPSSSEEEVLLAFSVEPNATAPPWSVISPNTRTYERAGGLARWN